MQKFLLIVLITLSGCATNNNKNAQFEVERLNYIAGCSESGEFDENTCKCSFDYLVENFKTDFYKDPEVLDETSQKYSEFVMHSKKAYQLCIKE